MGNADRISVADQVLGHCAAWLSASPVRDPEQERMIMAIAAEVLPHVSRDHPHVEPLCAALVHLSAADAKTKMSAEFHAACATADFHKWRIGVGIELFRNRDRAMP